MLNSNPESDGHVSPRIQSQCLHFSFDVVITDIENLINITLHITNRDFNDHGPYLDIYLLNTPN